MSNSPTGTGQMQLEALRPFDDFLWGSARFNMPNVQVRVFVAFGLRFVYSNSLLFVLISIKDLEKWNNRIVQNLLYYQTNYLYASLAVIGLFLLWNPSQTLLILSLLALVVGAYIVLFAVPSQRIKVAPQLADLSRAIPPQSRSQVFAGTLAITALTLYIVGAVLNAVLLVLVPIFLSLVHASLRMRNVNNKMSNLLYQKVRHTPMGWLLQSLDRLVVQAEEASRDR